MGSLLNKKCLTTLLNALTCVGIMSTSFERKAFGQETFVRQAFGQKTFARQAFGKNIGHHRILHAPLVDKSLSSLGRTNVCRSNGFRSKVAKPPSDSDSGCTCREKLKGKVSLYH